MKLQKCHSIGILYALLFSAPAVRGQIPSVAINLKATTPCQTVSLEVPGTNQVGPDTVTAPFVIINRLHPRQAVRVWAYQ